MTSLQDRPSVEDRIIAATRAVASIVPDGSAPPLQLPAQPHRPRQPRASFRPDWSGRPRVSRLATPVAATAAVVAVIAASVGIANRADSRAPVARAGLAGVPRYYLELGSSSSGSIAPASNTSSTAPATVGGSTAPAATTSTAPAATTSSTAPAATTSSTAPAATTSTAPAIVSGIAGPGDIVGGQAVIRDTLTGATVATIRPPRPFDSFVTVAAAADDRTFVLAAQNISGSGISPCGSTKLFLAQLNEADGEVKVRLTALPVPVFAATSQVDAMALSPDGTRLAVAREARQSCPTGGAMMVTPVTVPLKDLASQREQVSVYSLSGGAAKIWQSAPPWSISGPVGLNAMSWASDGMLAFNYPGAQGGPSGQGLRLLDTSKSGSLLGDSRLAVGAYLPPLRVSRDAEGRRALRAEFQRRALEPGGGAAPPLGYWAWSGDGVLAPDGTTVVAPMQRTLQRPEITGTEFGEFSASTGKQVRSLWAEHVPSGPFSVPYYSVLWTNSSGSVLVVAAPAVRGKNATGQSIYGVLSGQRFTPIPGLGGATALGPLTSTVVF